MRTKTILISIILIFFFCSCDGIFRAQIRNESKFETILKVKFDTIELHKFWGDRTYMSYLKSYPGYADISHIDFDTINLVKTFIIKPNETFPLEAGKIKPDLAFFKTITIINNDTLILKNKKEIQDAFKRVDTREWQLVVK